MSSGAKVISAFIRETVAGTTPASGDWSLLKRTSWGVKPTQNKGENNEIGGSRMAQGATPGTVDVGGDVGTKFRWGQHDDFLASCFGAEWSGDSLTMGNERITFSLATYASDVGIASVVRGAQVGSWKMQIPNDGDITATVTFAGLDWESKADEGNTNIAGVTVVFRAGEQEQTPPEGFESSGSETVLGTEVKYDTPITRAITSANIDRLRFTFGVQALVETTSKGDRNPSEVRLLVQIQRNGGWVTEKDITIKGKTTSQYLASVVVGNRADRQYAGGNRS